MALSHVNKERVEIGILEECVSYLLESRYFPSKVGGKPAWLDLKNLPCDLSCDVCGKPCIFLCQLYTPLDEKECYHRSVFLFICANSKCCKNNGNKNLKVFRCQLPQINDFYVREDPDDTPHWHPESCVENFSRVCALCGNLAPYNCSKCKQKSYCSRDHQIVDWKRYGHKGNCGRQVREVQIEVPFLFPEFEVWMDLIDDEDDGNKENKSEEDVLAEYKELVDKGADGTLSSASAQEIENYSAITDDKYFRKYKEWINKCPEQVLRYARGAEPIYVAKPNEDMLIPDCEACGEKRLFEFQIFSTLLNEIIDDSLNGLDWGTLLVYTCSKNCSKGPAYKKEFVYKQDILE